MAFLSKNKTRAKLPEHNNKHHKPFRWRYIGLFLAGLTLGVAITYRGGYLEKSPYDVNAVSPAVVKVYHFVCGQLVVNDQVQTKDFCDGGVGSGFLVSDNGYIATSGHVVTRDAADILISHLRGDPVSLQKFALSKGIDSGQLNNERATASLLASIYDSTPRELRLDNRRDITVVALGSRPLQVNNQDDIRSLFDKPDTDYIKKAEIVGVDFSAKDLLVIEQQADKGFSADDVALLKINASQTPYIKLSDTSLLKQGDALSLIGFPTDADNQLTSNDKLSPSITNGTINAIRTANGSDSVLYQTDADASQGNSGGPAVDENGQAIGIVTYRFKDTTASNAPKSYIRDISDLKNLLKSKSISLSTNSPSQLAWENGLLSMQQQHYSQAIKQFRVVALNYPAHRLVGTNIYQSQQSIKAGKEVKDPPYLLYLGLAFATMLITAGIALSIRHHRHHVRYKTVHTRKRNVVSPLA